MRRPTILGPLLFTRVAVGALAGLAGCHKRPERSALVTTVSVQRDATEADSALQLVYASSDAHTLSPRQVATAIQDLDRQRALTAAHDLGGASSHDCGSPAPSRLRLALGTVIAGACPGADGRRTTAIFADLEFRHAGNAMTDASDLGWQLSRYSEAREGANCRVRFRAEKPDFGAVYTFDLVEHAGAVDGTIMYSQPGIAPSCGYGFRVAGTLTSAN
jgi:hypothetical protein